MPLEATENDSPVPSKLLRAIDRAGSERRFAKQQGINISYVSNFLRLGEEPTDKTERGREVRIKMFLPRTKRQSKRKPRTLIQKAISGMVRETRKAVLKPPAAR